MTDAWAPSASPDALRVRAALLTGTRAFFARRGILEVETPLLGHSTVADLHLRSFCLRYDGPRLPASQRLYLQTSPELHMKRLLAAGSGPIFQICKAFRDGEAGRLHNPEFTILEWYRPGFDHHALMDEMDELLHELLEQPAALRTSYRDLFAKHLGIDPFEASTEEMVSKTAELEVALAPDERDTALELLMSRLIQPHLGHERPVFVYDYPESQATLARLRPGEPVVAERFEVYLRGVELANGFHELTDPAEQRRRFENDLEKRRTRGLDPVIQDENLLAALEHGLPPCAGVAVGFDRLVMLAARVEGLDDVVAFPIDRA